MYMWLFRYLASLKGISFGNALTDSPFPCFILPEESAPITLERTLAAEDGL